MSLVKKLGLGIVLILILLSGILFYLNQDSNENPIDIVFITDDNYILPTKTAIRSIVKNKNHKTKIEINVLGFNISENKIKEITKEQKRKVKINVIKVSDKDIQGLDYNAKVTTHVTRADYLKFFLPSIFKNKDKILYLDSDIIVLKDLSELFNTNIDDYYLAVVDEFGEKINEKRKSATNRYFNNGVLLLNLQNIRKDNIEQKLLDCKNKDKISDYVTQDTFNRVMDKVYFLHLKYNFFATTYDDNNKDFDFLMEFIEKMLDKNYNPLEYLYENPKDFKKDIVIIHYGGFAKPWKKCDYYGESFNIWYRYAPLKIRLGKIKSDIMKSKKEVK